MRESEGAELGGPGLQSARPASALPKAKQAGAASRSGGEAREIENLFSSALARLAEETGAEAAVAWLVASGGPAVRVAAPGTADLNEEPPSPSVLAALAERGAADLREPDVPTVLGDYSRKAGFEAAAPLVGTELTGAILLRGPMRPRTLAVLGEVAERLQGPAATAASIARLARVEEELTRMTRLANLGDLLAETVHEIRNPLVSVKTFLQLLPENLDDPDFHTNFRGQVVDEVRRMERLLDGILEQARPSQADEDEEVRASVGDVLASVARLLEKRAQEKQLKLVVDLGADLPDAAIDADPLRQIVLNLTLNAFEASPDGGCVRLLARASQAGDELRIAVDDEGPGVPEEERVRLFEAFVSTRADRPVGLGLAVCRRLVEAADGSICVRSAPGEAGGARFRISLPAAPEDGAAERSAPN